MNSRMLWALMSCAASIGVRIVDYGIWYTDDWRDPAEEELI